MSLIRTKPRLAALATALCSKRTPYGSFPRHYSPLPHSMSSRQTRLNRLKQLQNQISPSTSPQVNTSNNLANLPSLLTSPTVVLERQIEIMNVAFGFEQRNNYAALSPTGNPMGSLVERDSGFLSVVLRQVYRLHRPFHVDVFDEYGQLALTIKRSFSLINSHIKVICNGEVVGESVQRWHLWRRRYDLFVKDDGGKGRPSDDVFVQFGEIDSRFLAFDFPVRDQQGHVLASIDRNWVGLAREMFTDSGVYVIRMGDDSSNDDLRELYSEVKNRKLGWRERAVLLANAVSIDFDYFSRHSGSGGTVGYYE